SLPASGAAGAGALATPRTAPPPTDGLSLHDALPVCFTSFRVGSARRLLPPSRPTPARTNSAPVRPRPDAPRPPPTREEAPKQAIDRKSTRLNSSHVKISYAVFCLKEKTEGPVTQRLR